MIFVQFADESQTKIVSIFGVKQDETEYKNQGEVELSDTRYKAFYDALPDQIKSTIPTPEELKN